MDGKLIVFEGVEGSGKSTQILRLKQWLQTHPGFQQLQAKGIVPALITTREPGGTVLGKALRSLLLDKSSAPLGPQAELLLYAADRAQHIEEVIQPALKAGSWVLCDRFIDSTVAYQGYGRGLNLPLIDQLNQIAIQETPYHLTLWLQLSVETGLARSQARGQLDRMEQANLPFHQRVQQGFETLANQHPERIVAIDAAPSEAAVAQQIQAVMEERLQTWYGTHLQAC
ncbi:MAG: dTMP kinase [Leptolyngbya sp. SIO1D8]|nr:dTMP kinase [Leptolyngbya sp. SIO1D8]